MIRTRSEALRTLGLPLSAKEADVKAAYKALVKIYHPDTGCDNKDAYQRISEAYEFLINDRLTISSQRIVGDSPRRYGSQKDYESWEKKVKKQKEQKAREFEQKVEAYSLQRKKEDEQYKKAMDAINAIRAAQAIEAMIWANGLEKDNKK